MSHFKRLIFSWGFIFILVFSVIFTQQVPSYMDLSISDTLKPSQDIKQVFEHHNSPINITLFCSNTLMEDLELTPIQHWLKSISRSIKTTQIDPVKFPAKADHYDITSDGIIVIESNQKRFDIDLVDLILTHSEFSIQVLQNYLLKGLLNITSTTQKSIVIIHSSPESIINDDRPLGLSTLTNILNNNNIQLSEFSLDSIQDIPLSFDALILYKLGPNITQHTETLNHLIDSTQSVLMLSHPKFAQFSNRLMTNIFFNEEVIQDDAFHLMNSSNQLIVDYKSTLSKNLIAVLPYSSFISFEDDSMIESLANSSEYSYVMYDNNVIPGPFSIMAKSTQKNHYYLNNYLLLSNYWIIQGNNNEIVEDIIFSLVDSYPMFSQNIQHGQTLLLSYDRLFKLISILIILPIVLIIVIQLIIRYLKN